MTGINHQKKESMYKISDQLVVGMGEVGTAIAEIIGCEGIDMDFVSIDLHKVIHICIPYSQDFIDIAKAYVKESQAELVIIHSTVPIGTTDKIPNAVHSPIRGIHPNLAEGIKTFVKYFGGKKAREASKIFEELGIETKVVKDARTSEAMKLLDTTQYGLQIMIEKEIYKFCQDNNVDFADAYHSANQTYNEGYMKLGKPEVVRPWLTHIEGKIGGHCVIQNLELIDWWMADLLKSMNNKNYD